MDRPLSIGQVAMLAHVTTHTVRYYEKRNLLPTADRHGTGRYRAFTLETVSVVRFIRAAQALCFTLREIRELLAERGLAAKGTGCAADIALAKMEWLDLTIRRMTLARKQLNSALEHCRRMDAPLVCPVLELIETRSGSPQPAAEPSIPAGRRSRKPARTR
ncbi:MAG: MerR family transcriptional regulator [Candidatus Wallbacteria bacterium]|nr:MerR family transcriptional regulator [Candidatus Wallbacteria bacterium]